MANENKYFWGEPTSTIDWCEANYEVTKYIAEFWNTVSNLVMIALPIYGIYGSLKQRHCSKLNNFTLRPSTFVVYFALLMIAIGSWLFHATLLYPMQLLDELPMLYAFSIALYSMYDLLKATYQLENEATDKETFNKMPSSLAVFILIFLYCLSITYLYVNVFKNPIFHETAFGFLVALNVLLAYQLLLHYKLPKKLYILALTYLILAFTFWNIDNKLCAHLKNYRLEVENLFGITKINSVEFNFRAFILNSIVITLKALSEFHSLWHVFTAFSCYLGILCLVEFNYEYHLKACKIKTSKNRPLYPICLNMFYDYARIENETTNKGKTKYRIKFF